MSPSPDTGKTDVTSGTLEAMQLQPSEHHEFDGSPSQGSQLANLAVDGLALLSTLPRPIKRDLPKRQQGVVLTKPFVPFDVRTTRLLGLPLPKQ